MNEMTDLTELNSYFCKQVSLHLRRRAEGKVSSVNDLVHIILDPTQKGGQNASWERIDKIAELSLTKAPSAVDALIEVASQEKYWQSSWAVGQAAILALGMIKDARAAKPLLGMLESNKNMPLGIIYALIWSLGEIRDSSAVKPLIDKLRRESRLKLEMGKNYFGSERLIVEALRKLSGTDFGNDLQKWEEWYKTSHGM